MSDYSYEYDSDSDYEDNTSLITNSNYKVINLNYIWNEINDIINNLMELQHIDRDESISQLISNNWQISFKYKNIEKINFGSECIICFDKTNLIIINDCNHVCCKDCLEQYIKINKNLNCPGFKCKTIIHQSIFNYSEELSNICNSYIINNYIDSNKNIIYCPSTPFCGNLIITSLYTDTQYVHCSCGMQICYKCKSKVDHQPLCCQDNIEWNKLINDTDNLYIITKCKECPWCLKLVEKEYGCNFMTCTTNKNQWWCWKCGGKVSSRIHDYKHIEGHKCKKNITLEKNNNYLEYYNNYLEYKNDIKAFNLKSTTNNNIINLQYQQLSKSTTFAMNLMIYIYLHDDDQLLELYKHNLYALKKNINICADLLKFTIENKYNENTNQRLEYLFKSLDQKIISIQNTI